MPILSNKFDELKFRISISNPDIVIITEVFCKSGDPIIELNIQGYTTTYMQQPYISSSWCLYFCKL